MTVTATAIFTLRIFGIKAQHTPTVSVQLNSFMSLNMALVSFTQLRVGTDTHAAYLTDSMVRLAGLSGFGNTSFNLPDGISVVSVQGGFAEVGGASAVPVPAAIWLFGSGLIGLIGITRRKKAPAGGTFFKTTI